MLQQSDQQYYDWDNGSDTSEWSGVSVDSNGRITGLHIENRGISGELPTTLGDISHLEYLHATSNGFVGENVTEAFMVTISKYNKVKGIRLRPVYE